MKKRLVHAGGIGDVLRARAIETGAMKHLARGSQDTGTGIGVVLTIWFNHVVNLREFRCCPQVYIHK